MIRWQSRSFPVLRSAGGGLLGGAIPHAKTAAAPVQDRGTKAQKWDVFSFDVVLLEMLTRRGSADHASLSTSVSFSAPSTTMDRSRSGEHGTVPEVVRWVRRGFEEDTRPVTKMVDPALLREAPPLPKNEVVAAFHVAMACTEVDPELRPRMKAVADRLDKIGSILLS